MYYMEVYNDLTVGDVIKQKKSMGVNKIKLIYSHALISVQSVCVIAVLLYLIAIIISYFTKNQ